MLGMVPIIFTHIFGFIPAPLLNAATVAAKTVLKSGVTGAAPGCSPIWDGVADWLAAATDCASANAHQYGSSGIPWIGPVGGTADAVLEALVEESGASALLACKRICTTDSLLSKQYQDT